VPKETRFNETPVWQVPVQETGESPLIQELSLADFSRLIASLIRWNLIFEETDPGNDQEKLYSITIDDGKLTLFVYSARMKKDVPGTPGIP